MSKKIRTEDKKITISFAIRPDLLAQLEALKSSDNDRSRVICDIIQAHIHTKQSEEKHNGG